MKNDTSHLLLKAVLPTSSAADVLKNHEIKRSNWNGSLSKGIMLILLILNVGFVHAQIVLDDLDDLGIWEGRDDTDKNFHSSHRNTYKDFQIGAGSDASMAITGRVVHRNELTNRVYFMQFRKRPDQSRRIKLHTHTTITGNVFTNRNLWVNSIIESGKDIVVGENLHLQGGNKITRSGSDGLLSFTGFKSYDFDSLINAKKSVSVSENLTVEKMATVKGKAAFRDDLTVGTSSVNKKLHVWGHLDLSGGAYIQDIKELKVDNSQGLKFTGSKTVRFESPVTLTKPVSVSSTMTVGSIATFNATLRATQHIDTRLKITNTTSNKVLVEDPDGINLIGPGGILLNGPVKNTIGNNPVTIADDLQIVKDHTLDLFAVGKMKNYQEGIQLELNDPSHYFSVIGNTVMDKLLVSENIRTKNIEVEPKTDAWPDYVFEDSYPLMPLDELEGYISKNNHLPKIASAEEIGEEGYDVATMDAALLEKIEELTLYILELKKEINQLKESNNK